MSNGWPQVPLQTIAKPVTRAIEVVPGKLYRTIGVKLWGNGAYERKTIDGSQTAAKTLSLVRENDLIINKIWVRNGTAAVVSKAVDGCVGSGEFPTFELDQSKVLPPWLHWMTKTPWFWASCDALSQGTSGKNRIRPELFLTITVPLPPIAEQRRIVARIEQLAGRIEEARRLRRLAVGEVAALAASAANLIFDKGNFANYSATTLGEAAEIQSGVTLGRSLSGKTVWLPYLRVANVQDGYLDLRVIKEIEILPHEVERWELQKGDVLLTEGGDWDKLGRGTVWQGEIENCIHQNHIFRVRVKQSEIDPYFLSALLGSPLGKAYFQEAAKQTTNLATINQRQLKAFKIPCLPLDEQRRIVAYLDDLQARVDSLKQLQAQTRAELDALLPSVLDKAFKGEL